MDDDKNTTEDSAEDWPWTRDSGEAVARGEPVCFWCTDPFYPGNRIVFLDREMCNTNGSHVENIWLHASCAEDMQRTLERTKSFLY
jgi:hypothetical protein